MSQKKKEGSKGQNIDVVSTSVYTAFAFKWPLLSWSIHHGLYKI